MATDRPWRKTRTTRIIKHRDPAMSEPQEHPPDSRLRRHKEYEDPHFHDDAEVAPLDEAEEGQGHRLPGRRKNTHKPPTRRRYEESRQRKTTNRGTDTVSPGGANRPPGCHPAGATKIGARAQRQADGVTPGVPPGRRYED